MTFRTIALAGAVLLALAIAKPGPAEARSGFYVGVSPYGASFYYGPRYWNYYAPRRYYYAPYYYYPRRYYAPRYYYGPRYYYPRQKYRRHYYRRW